MRFKDYILEEQEYNEFICFLDTKDYLNEGILDKLSGALKKKITFIQEIAKTLKMDVKELIVIFRNKKVFKFFSQIGWSLAKLFKLVKDGFNLIQVLTDVISQYISQNKILKWTTNELHKLDEFLKSHPKTKKIVGIAVAGILIYIWFNMAFTGNVEYDFGMDDVLNALAGKVTLANIFGGADGIKLLMLFAAGVVGLSFPWPGAASAKFIFAIFQSLVRSLKLKFTIMRP